MTCTLFQDQSAAERQAAARMLPMYITNYFRDKTIPPDTDLHSPRYISLCMDTNMCDGSDMAYRCIENSGMFESSDDDQSIGEDIKFVIRILSRMKQHVPQEFSAGVLLMHLELVEGISLLTEI